MKSITIEINPTGIIEQVESFFEAFRRTITMELEVPTSVYARTRLLCEYISDKVGVRYHVSELLMTIYLEFLQKSIEGYNPTKIYEEITRSYGYGERLVIHAEDRVYEYEKRSGTKTILTITIDKKDARKGELILEEMDELFGNVPPLEGLFSTLWINFIEEYKRGNNQKALNAIIRSLKKTLK